MTFTVAVAGASGRLGQSLIRVLLGKPGILVRGLVRDKAKVSASVRDSSSLSLIEGDVQNATVLRDLVNGADVVISALMGDNKLMYESQKLLIDLSEEAGVPRFVASDYTLDYTKLDYGQLPSKDPMKLIQDYLTEKKIKSVHVLIGAFMDTFWTNWFGLWNREDFSLSFWGTGNEYWELTSYKNAAEFVAEVACDKGAFGFQKFLGDRITIQQIAGVFRDVYGDQPKLKQLGTLVDLKEKMEKESIENPQAYMTWMPLFYQYYCINGQTHLGPQALDTTYPGLKHESLKTYLERHSLDALATAMFNVGTAD